jgi:hypothetical protein
MIPSPDSAARGSALVSLFSTAEAFGTMRPVVAEQVPHPHRELLDHHSHMTVAMERFHGQPVSLRVVATRPPTDPVYSREILLLDSQGRPVQYGIVGIDLALVATEVAARIRAADTPLGRVLIEAGALCDVQQVELLEIAPGPHLAGLIGPGHTFGRVATIAVAGRSAVQLLEVVAGIQAT